MEFMTATPDRDEGQPAEKKRPKLIQWDEETIAEHDKERGSRQKIDEAPTPYRYQSESDGSGAESGSDGESLFSHRRRTSSADNHPMPSLTTGRDRTGSGCVQDAWSTFTAKLHYEKHLQDLQDMDQDTPSSSASAGHEHGHDQHVTDFGEIAALRNGHPIRPAMKHEAMVTSPTKHKHKHKSVHIKGTEGPFGSTAVGPQAPGPDIFAGISSSSCPPDSAEQALPQALGPAAGGPAAAGGAAAAAAAGGEAPGTPTEPEHKDFLDKRAGHYNEFKVLQAMRAKLMEEEDEDEDET